MWYKIHLWLGLISAPIVLFVCITGCIIVFGDEIIELSAGKARYVSEMKDEKVAIEDIVESLKKQFPERRKPFYVVTYKDPQRSIRCNMFEPGKGLRMVYVDPYTGAVLKDDTTINFFYITAHLHNELMLHETGQWIIDIAVLIFLVLIITGMILWWPKSWSKKHVNGAFKIKLKTTWNRINRDLHIVLGFYASCLLLLLCVTGLMIAFKPFAAITQKSFGGDPTQVWEKALPKKDTLAVTSYPLNKAIQATYERYPDKEEVQVYTFLLEKQGYYHMIASDKTGLKSRYAPQYSMFDRYSGEVIEIPEEVVKTENIENVYWSLHMGTYWGIWGKIIVFLGGLVGSTLPVTGFYMWWSRIRKRKISLQV